MTALRDIAWAKLNLTLEVSGRRADGFHELNSLVAFAGLGDTVELEPERNTLDLKVEGPFAGALDGGNLILDAAEAAKARSPGIALGRFRLFKALPVAAGLGGGSADAAAALRLIVRANQDGLQEALSEAAMADLAPVLGSDVAVCFRSEPALITGRGEMVAPVCGFPSCGVVLANPGLPLSTADVYGELDAPSLPSPPRASAPLDFAGDFDALLDYVGPRGNDLEAVAIKLAPEVGDVLAALRMLDDARLVRLSGSGPTCFAVFATPRQALRAATALAQSQPDWWIATAPLGDPEADART
jgi:4-diphosphocytidyl-2-C-methyl-D-erythritol kinase